MPQAQEHRGGVEGGGEEEGGAREGGEGGVLARGSGPPPMRPARARKKARAGAG